MVQVEVLPRLLSACGLWPEGRSQVSEKAMLEIVRRQAGELRGVWLRAALRVCSALVILQGRRGRGRKG